MSLLLAMIIGCAIGGVAGRFFMKNIDYLLLNVLTGIVGAVLGLAFFLFTRNGPETGLFSIAGILSDIVGALIAVLIMSGIQLLSRGEEAEKHQN
jgi:uncharacterized membrane protein YeaQ/YmgE (transglycosylase-associated protein family)